MSETREELRLARSIELAQRVMTLTPEQHVRLLMFVAGMSPNVITAGLLHLEVTP